MLQYLILSLNDPMCFKTSIKNQFSINKQQVNRSVKPLPVQSRGSEAKSSVYTWGILHVWFFSFQKILATINQQIKGHRQRI